MAVILTLQSLNDEGPELREVAGAPGLVLPSNGELSAADSRSNIPRAVQVSRLAIWHLVRKAIEFRYRRLLNITCRILISVGHSAAWSISAAGPDQPRPATRAPGAGLAQPY